MIFSQWMRASVFLLPLVMLLTNSIEVWHVYVVQIIIGLITPLYTPASQAITPSIVGKEQLQDANAYIDGMTRFMMFLEFRISRSSHSFDWNRTYIIFRMYLSIC